jgi:predicted metalloprotease with PDZ domain
MINVHLAIASVEKQRLRISIQFPLPTSEVFIPAWRPGRYMAQWFSPLVKNLHGVNRCGGKVKLCLVSDTCWKADEPVDQISYEFEAKTFDGGGSWVGEDVVYLNPVNAILYSKDSWKEEIKVSLDVPSDFQRVCGKPFQGNVVVFKNFDELYDHPLVASNRLQKFEYTVEGIRFYSWFYGLNGKTWSDDWLAQNMEVFEKFTRAQWELFGSFPFEEFHFITLVPEYSYYHGVEHLSSTMLVLGPPERVLMHRPKDLWGMASHELFHCWNIKTIRPASLLPYDFSQPQYSSLGYVYEGFTTYYGDEILYRCGAFSMEDWLEEISARLLEHRNKPGRLELSLADSSILTRMGGYDAKTKSERQSIYTEGMLNALIIDTFLQKNTGKKIRLDDLMRRMYRDALEGKGYTQKSILSHLYDIDPSTHWQAHFEKYYYSPVDLTYEVLKCLEFWGVRHEWKGEELVLVAQ